PRWSRYRADSPFHLVLRSRVPPPLVVPQSPMSSLTVFPDPQSDYLRASHPVVSRVLAPLVTHPIAPPLFVSALVTTVSAFASSDCLDHASHNCFGRWFRSSSSSSQCLKMLSLLPESWLQFTSGLSLPQNQSLWTLEWVRTKILEEDFRRRQLRGGDDGSSGYGMQGSKRGRGRGFGGAGRGAKKDDDSNDQQGGTGWGRGAKTGCRGKSGAGGKMKGSCWYCEKEGHPWFLCYKKPDGWTPRNRHQDGGARRNQKNGANMFADSSDHNPKGNGGAEKKEERTVGQFFHIGEQGEQEDASSKVGAGLHPLDYWVLDTGAAWTMTPCKELLDVVRAAPINEVCSASGHALKVAGAGWAAFEGADGKPVVLHDVLLVPDLKANLISLRMLAKAGVSTCTNWACTYKGQLGNRVLWDLHESKDVYRSMWQLPALA
ncbi:unnamed protein product, partial [Closterium sp. NIES-54]